MDPTDLTVEILKGIRDEVRSTNDRLDGANLRLDRLSGSALGSMITRGGLRRWRVGWGERSLRPAAAVQGESGRQPNRVARDR
jgi:hypothetical protein